MIKGKKDKTVLITPQRVKRVKLVLVKKDRKERIIQQKVKKEKKVIYPQQYHQVVLSSGQVHQMQYHQVGTYVMVLMEHPI